MSPWADAKTLFEVLEGRIHERVDARSDRVIHQDVETTKRSDRIRYQPVEGVEVGDIAFDCHSLAVEAGFDISDGLFTFTQCSPDGNDGHASLRQ